MNTASSAPLMRFSQLLIFRGNIQMEIEHNFYFRFLTLTCLFIRLIDHEQDPPEPLSTQCRSRRSPDDSTELRNNETHSRREFYQQSLDGIVQSYARYNDVIRYVCLFASRVYHHFSNYHCQHELCQYPCNNNLK